MQIISYYKLYILRFDSCICLELIVNTYFLGNINGQESYPLESCTIATNKTPKVKKDSDKPDIDQIRKLKGI